MRAAQAWHTRTSGGGADAYRHTRSTRNAHNKTHTPTHISHTHTHTTRTCHARATRRAGQDMGEPTQHSDCVPARFANTSAAPSHLIEIGPRISSDGQPALKRTTLATERVTARSAKLPAAVPVEHGLALATLAGIKFSHTTRLGSFFDVGERWSIEQHSRSYVLQGVMASSLGRPAFQGRGLPAHSARSSVPTEVVPGIHAVHHTPYPTQPTTTQRPQHVSKGPNTNPLLPSSS